LLLDTCTFLWLNSEVARIPKPILELCTNLDNALFLSSASAWEIAAKEQAGKLSLPQPAWKYIPARRAQNGISTLGLDEEAVLQLPKLPLIHRDPFDRMLVCQAVVHGLSIVTPDPWIAQYPVRVLW
jgi:PIN domain nuclease of toxin-antitoxin system